MGLGPLVCERCRVMAHLDDDKGWHCRYCGSTDLGHTLSFDKIEAYYQNEKVFKFFLGEDPNAPASPKSQ